jgi:type IV pilus assembly protein PilA
VVRGTAEPAEIVEGAGTMPLTAGVWAAIVFFMFIPLAGILAAIAIPVYQDAVVRAKMVEAIHEGAQLKPDAAREIEAYKADPAAGGASSHAVTPKSQYITRIVIDKPARAIDVVLDGRKIGALQEAAPRIRWIVAEDGATWSCEAAGVPDKYLPADCRH